MWRGCFCALPNCYTIRIFALLCSALYYYTIEMMIEETERCMYESSDLLRCILCTRAVRNSKSRLCRTGGRQPAGTVGRGTSTGGRTGSPTPGTFHTSDPGRRTGTAGRDSTERADLSHQRNHIAKCRRSMELPHAHHKTIRRQRAGSERCQHVAARTQSKAAGARLCYHARYTAGAEPQGRTSRPRPPDRIHGRDEVCRGQPAHPVEEFLSHT